MDDRNVTHVVEMREIVKTFPGVRALDGVSFAVRPGEIHALVGKNGAGKSTLMQILTGLYPQDSGRIVVRGEEIERMTTSRAKEAGIALVAQHAKFVPGLSIAENVFTGPSRARGLGSSTGTGSIGPPRAAPPLRPGDRCPAADGGGHGRRTPDD
jgi:ribose transport system ATP-binding protein